MFGFPGFQGLELVQRRDRILCKVSVHLAIVQREILYLAFMKGHVVVTEAISDLLPITFRQCQHLIVHVDAEYPAFGADDLCGDVAYLAPTAAEIEHRFPPMQMPGRIATAIITLQDLLGDGLQIAVIVGDRTAESVFLDAGGLGVAVSYRSFYVDGCVGHRELLGS